MPNEASALPELLAALPDAAGYDAVHTALMATEGGRRFLAEFAARNRHADTTMIVAAVARVEAAIRGERASPPPAAAGAGELIEIAAAVDRIRTAILAAGTSPSKLGAAIERIQDLAFALHERAVDTPLRDALDAALGELAAVAGGASDRGTVELLHALASRVAEMIGERGGGSRPAASTDDLPPPTNLFALVASDGEAFAQAVASLAAAPAPSADASPPVSAPSVESVAAATLPADAPEESSSGEPARGQGAETESVEIAAPASDAAEPQPAPAIEPDPVETLAEWTEPAEPEVSDSAAILTQAFGDDVFVAKEVLPAAAPMPEGEVDRVDQVAEPAPPPNEAATPAEEAAAPAQEAAVPTQDAGAAAEEAAAPVQSAASRATAGPEEDPADLFEPQSESAPPAASAPAAAAEDTPASAAAPMEPAQPPEPPESARVVPPPLRAIPRPPLSDPLAAVRDLSDEERIALFS